MISFQPVSVSSIFSKMYEKIVKNFLISKVEHYFSPFISTFRKSLSIEYVFIRLLEDWRNKLDNINVVDAVLTWLSKAFDWIPHDLLTAKRNAYGFNREVLYPTFTYISETERNLLEYLLLKVFLEISL